MILNSKKEKNSVVIGYVHNGTVTHEFMDSYTQSLLYDVTNDSYYHSTINVSTPYIPLSRNMVVTEFLKTKAEWLIFLDTDLVFPVDTIKALTEVADKDSAPIVGALYFNYYSDGNMHPIWLEETYDGELTTISSINSNELKSLAVVATGASITHRSVYERMESQTSDPWHWFGHDLTKNGKDRLGEDCTFCTRARTCGFPVYGYAGLVMQHKKARLIGLDEFTSQKFVQNMLK